MDYIETFVADTSADFTKCNSFDESHLLHLALKAVLPTIINDALTDRQRFCLTEFYVNGKTQVQIASELGISQSTVHKHIVTAKRLTATILDYCRLAVNNVTSSLIDSDYM